MDAVARWMPLACVAVVAALAGGNARRMRRRLGHSVVTVFQSPLPSERLRIWFALVAVGVLGASSVLPELAASPRLPAPIWVRLAGLALLVAALVLALAAFGTLGESWRIGVDPEHESALVTGGVYRVARHPIYAAFVWCFVGLVLLDPSLFHAVYACGGYALCRTQASREERFLIERHGAAYVDYRARTGRFVPRLG